MTLGFSEIAQVFSWVLSSKIPTYGSWNDMVHYLLLKIRIQDSVGFFFFSFFFNKINRCMRRSILHGTKLDSHTSYFKRGTFPQYSVPNKCELMMAWPCTINQFCGDDIHKLLWWALIRQNWHLPKDTSCGPKVRRAVHYKILLGTWRNSYVWDGQLYR